MATVNVKMLSVCAGGDHAVVELTKGAQVKNVNMSVSELKVPITQDDVETFARLTCRMLYEGKTNAQFKTAMLAGFEVIV